MSTLTETQRAGLMNLHRLFWLRNIAILVQLTAVGVAHLVLHIALTLVEVLLVIVLLLFFNGITEYASP